MNNPYTKSPHPYNQKAPMYPDRLYNPYKSYPCTSCSNTPKYNPDFYNGYIPNNNEYNSYNNEYNSYNNENNSYNKKNNSYDKKNNSYDRKNNSYDRKNNSYDKKNNSYDKENNSYDKENNSYDKENNSYDKKNNSYDNGREYDSAYDFTQYTTDYGPKPFVVNIDEVTKHNNTFRTALWTGTYLQLTLMSIDVGEDIGLEVHPDLDQFIRIEEGQGLVNMGDREDALDFEEYVYDDFAFIIPAGMWHNLINTGNSPLKLYSIYAPPQHPRGTIHETKAIAEEAERYNGH